MHAHDAHYTVVPTRDAPYTVVPTRIRTPGGFELALGTAVGPATGFGELVALLQRQQHEFPVPLAELHSHDDLSPLYALVDSATDRVVHTIHDAASWDRARAHVLHLGGSGGQMSHHLLVHHRPAAASTSTSTTTTTTSTRATTATTREIGLEVEMLAAAGRVRAPASAIVASPGYAGLLFAVAAGVRAHFPLVVPSAPLQLVLFGRHGAGLGSIVPGPAHLHDLDAVARVVAVFRLPPSIAVAGHRACDCVGHGTVRAVGAGHGSGGHPVGGHIVTGRHSVTELAAVGHAGGHAVSEHVGYEHDHAVSGHTGYEHGHAVGGHTGYEHGHSPDHGHSGHSGHPAGEHKRFVTVSRASSVDGWLTECACSSKL